MGRTAGAGFSSHWLDLDSGPFAVVDEVTVAVHEAASATDPGAFEEDSEQLVTRYFREHSPSVYRYLTGVYGREEDAEEVIQEAFLRLHQAICAREPIESPRAWTLTVARRLMLDRIRRDRSDSQRRDSTICVVDTLRDPRPSAEESLDKARRRAALTRAVLGLTHLERKCLYARAEGLTLKEIGVLVNMDLRRVAEVVNRAVRTLQGRVRA